MTTKLQQELSSNKNYIFFGFGISALTLLPQFIFSPSIKHSTFLGITLILLYFIPKFSKILFAIFIIFLNLSNIVIGHIAIHWSYARADISPRIEVAILSPSYESIEYLNTYITYQDALIVIYTIFTLWLLTKFLMYFKHSFKLFKIIGLGFFTTIIILVSLYENPLKKIEPYSIPDKYLNIKKNKEYGTITIERKKYLNTLQYTPKINKDTLYNKIIIIMGESANKHHMSIYGYKQNTTPFLSSLHETGNMYIFNAIAPTNQTRYSVPILLTKSNVYNFLELYLNSTSIISDFRMNGYKTYWFSNQGRVGKHDSFISSMADEAEIEIFANLNYSKSEPDEVILNYLNEVNSSQNQEMYLSHLIGSHAAYKKRYTQEKSLILEPTNIFEEYDNSIYYTDYILSEVYKKFRHEKLLLIYFADHGEVVSTNKRGHGFLPPFKDEYEIPFIIFSNINNSRLDEIHKKNKDTYYNAENMNYIINYIAGISNDANISFSNKVFSLDPKNIFNYNNLKFYKNAKINDVR